MKVKQDKVILQCSFCARRFKKVIVKNTVEVKCPGCGGYGVEVIGIATDRTKEVGEDEQARTIRYLVPAIHP